MSLWVLLLSYSCLVAHGQEDKDAVAFTAELSYDRAVFKDQIIPFDKNVTNIGGRFMSNIGVFVCPDNDLYAFYWSLQSPVPNAGLDQGRARLMLAQAEVKYGPATSIQHDATGIGFSGTSQMAAVLRCSELESVRLLADGWSDIKNDAIYNKTFSSFTGFQISSTDEDEDIAFTAQLGTSSLIVPDQRVEFDDTIGIFQGGAEEGPYYPNHGTFVCPDDELYMFTWTIQATGATRATAALVFEGNEVFFGPNTYRTFRTTAVPNSGTSSTSAVLRCQLNKGVWVIMKQSEAQVHNLVDANFTSFTGFRVNSGVGFSAQMTENDEFAAGRQIIFDYALANSGGPGNDNPYNPNTGIFTCPDEDVYFFTWGIQVESYAVSARLTMGGFLVKEGPFTTYVAPASIQGVGGSASTSVVVQCVRGASVQVVIQDVVGAPTTEATAFLNYFAGIKLPGKVHPIKMF